MIVKVQKSWERSARAQVFFPGRDNEPLASFSLHKTVGEKWRITLEHDIEFDDTSYLHGKELEYENNKYGGGFVSTDNYVTSRLDGNYSEDKIEKAIIKMLDDKHVQRIILINIFNEVAQ